LGEGAGSSRLAPDAALLDLVSSANIACGFHAGDITTMTDTVRAARDRGVSIGAHPSYPDIPGFGRRELHLDPREIHFHVSAQLHALGEICRRESARLAYVKPHGALYNRAATDGAAADAISASIRDAQPSLTLLGLANSAMERSARRNGIRFAREAFVDRAYSREGTLVPRDQPGAIIEDVDVALDRALRLVQDGVVATASGEEIRISPDSLCVHGDNPDAAPLLQALRTRLEKAGVTIASFCA
jgi:UPF0271 protein